MKSRVFQTYRVCRSKAPRRTFRLAAAVGVVAGALLLPGLGFGQTGGGAGTSGGGSAGASGNAGIGGVGTGGQTGGGNLGAGGRVSGGTRSGAVRGGTRSGAVRGGTRSGAVGGGTRSGDVRGDEWEWFNGERSSNGNGNRNVNRDGDTLSERGAGRNTSNRYVEDGTSLSERGAGRARSEDRRDTRVYDRNSSRNDRDARTLRGETVFSGDRGAWVDDDRGVGYDYPGAYSETGRRYYAGRATVPGDAAVVQGNRSAVPGVRDGVVYDEDRGRIDRDFSPQGPFDYNFPRRRNVGRDRELSDERYYDRFEFPDRYRGTTVPDPVRQSEYIPDYLPEYRRDDLIRAGRTVTEGTVNAFDPPHRDPEFLDYRGGGRLGRGPTGISDPEFMGAGGRDTAGRRRGVSGQSGAFGHRDRGVIVGDRPDFYGRDGGLGEVIDD